jgi:hypothetical protein
LPPALSIFYTFGMNSPAARRRRFLGPALGALALTVAGDVRALSFLSFDARSMAMGGTGVVTARAHNASLFNPALLTDADPDSGQRRYRPRRLSRRRAALPPQIR